MKIKHLTVFVFVLLCSVTNSKAATLIVNSHFPQPAGVYSTIQLAYNAASPGDTIVISPAEGEYAGISIAKKIHIVGNGWERPSVSIPNTKTGSITCNEGSQGSSITGLEVNGAFAINTSEICIQRNKCSYIIVSDNCINVVIKQNYISSSRSSSSPQLGSIVFISQNAQVSVMNNIICNTYPSGDYAHAFYTYYPVTVFFSNNIAKAPRFSINIGMNVSVYSTHSVFNNIILGGSVGGVSVTNEYNNLANSTQFIANAENNNQQNVIMNDVFVDATNYDFHLKELSPAIGAGFEGVDCGIYGGVFPFVDKGRSWLPIISEIEVPAMINAADGLDIGVKAKSGK